MPVPPYAIMLCACIFPLWHACNSENRHCRHLGCFGQNTRHRCAACIHPTSPASFLPTLLIPIAWCFISICCTRDTRFNSLLLPLLLPYTAHLSASHHPSPLHTLLTKKEGQAGFRRGWTVVSRQDRQGQGQMACETGVAEKRTYLLMNSVST